MIIFCWDAIPARRLSMRNVLAYFDIPLSALAELDAAQFTTYSTVTCEVLSPQREITYSCEPRYQIVRPQKYAWPQLRRALEHHRLDSRKMDCSSIQWRGWPYVEGALVEKPTNDSFRCSTQPDTRCHPVLWRGDSASEQSVIIIVPVMSILTDCDQLKPTQRKCAAYQ
jgi:hypothetical protein